MARKSQMFRRGKSGTFYSRIYNPVDLLDYFDGSEDRKISLRTSDLRTAKVRHHALVVEWDQKFDDLRKRRNVTPDDKATATWEHYSDTLELDMQKRRNMPTQEQIAAEEQRLEDGIISGEIDVSSFASMINANSTVELLWDARKNDQDLRRRKLAALKQHLASGETRLVQQAADEFIAGNNLIIDPTSDDYRDLCSRLIRAEVEALERTVERDEGNFGGTPKDPIVKPAKSLAAQQAAPGESILELFERYARVNKEGVKADTLDQSRYAVQLFVDYVGKGFAAHRIDGKIAANWRDLLLQYPRKASEQNAFRGMSFLQIIKANESLGKQTISRTTVNRLLSGLAAFCQFLVPHTLPSNPTHGLFLKKEKRKPKEQLNLEEMNVLFRSPLFTGCLNDASWPALRQAGSYHINDHKNWVVLISLFTGARPNEIVQLETRDLFEQNGIWTFHIADDGEAEDRTLKTEGSKRVVPVHSELIKLGLLEFHRSIVAQGHTRLFPDATKNSRGQWIADWSREFPRYLKRIGIDHPGASLYSFRHGATDAWRAAGLLDPQFKFLLGHSEGDMTSKYGKLPAGTVKMRRDLIEMIEYPGLDLEHLYVSKP